MNEDSWRFPWLRAGLLLTIVILGVSAWIWSAHETPPALEPVVDEPEVPTPVVRRPVMPPVAENWTGSAKCAECHAEISERYQRHPMAHSSARVQDATVIEDYTGANSFASPESRVYRVERTADQVLHHESMLAANGEVLYDQVLPVEFEIGSGKRGRSYVINWGSSLTVSPIAWYTEGQRWDLSPGYAPKNHPRFSRRVIDGCAECHVGRLAYDRDKPNRFIKPVMLEASIGCERCHGPGGDHVQWHESTEMTGTDPIVNPSKLAVAPREDVCNQCHLLGERLPRYGKTPHDFRPGQRIEDVWTVFVRGAGVDSSNATRAVSQVDQMRDSICFQKSQGRLGCTSCHDPHAVPEPAERVAYYDARCLKCHQEQGCALPEQERSAGQNSGSCIACHMPVLPTNNVPHASATDHRIVRRPNAPPPHVAEAGDLFDHAEERLPDVDVVRARALRRLPALAREPNPSLAMRLDEQLREVLKEFPDDVETLYALGSVSMIRFRKEPARDLWLAALKLQPEHEGVLKQLAMYESGAGNLKSSIRLLKRLIDIDPSQIEMYDRLAKLLRSDNQIDEALQTAREGLRLDPQALPLRQWLAQTCRELKRDAEASEQEDLLKRMQGR